MDLEADSAQNVAGALEFTNSQPRELVQQLERRGFQQIILGGGATVNGLFLKENLIDEIWLTIEPKIFGEGLSLFKDVDVDLDLELIEIKPLDKNIIHVRYKIKK